MFAHSQFLTGTNGWKNNLTTKKLERPLRAEGDKDKYNKYLTTAMVGRHFQRETRVIAMNGGIIATALAALETGDSPFTKIQWTVYPAWRVNPEKSKTLVQYVLEHKHECLNLVQQEGMSAPALIESCCLAGTCRMEQETQTSFVALHVRDDCGDEHMHEVNVAASGGSGDCNGSTVSNKLSSAADRVGGTSILLQQTQLQQQQSSAAYRMGGTSMLLQQRQLGGNLGKDRMSLTQLQLGCHAPTATGPHLVAWNAQHTAPRTPNTLPNATGRETPTGRNAREPPTNPRTDATTIQHVSITHTHSRISHHPGQ